MQAFTFIPYVYNAQKRRQGDMVSGKDDVIKGRQTMLRISDE